MAESFQFELVSPERKLASIAATSVQIPGMEGDLTAMPQHAPFLTTLRPGVVRVVAGGETSEYIVTGGFAEISPDAASVLAEQAVPRSEADAMLLDRLTEEVEAAFEEALEDAKLAAGQRVRDVLALRGQLGL